jgi:hypothetical protein
MNHLTINFNDLVDGVNWFPAMTIIFGAVAIYAIGAIVLMLLIKQGK